MKTLYYKARIAGFWYLIMGITAALGLMTIPSQFLVAGDSGATASKILNSPNLFRWGIFLNLISQVSFIFTVLALKELFKGVNKQQSQLMLAFVYASVPVAFLNTLNLGAAQFVLRHEALLSSFNQAQLQSLSLFFLDLFKYGTYLVEIFWGLWLLPFGVLVIKSGFLPKMIGIFLIIACFGYLAENFAAIIIPELRETVSVFTSISGTLGEVSIILWMLIVGARSTIVNKTQQP